MEELLLSIQHTNTHADSQGKQLGHVTEAVVGQRADLVVT